MYKGTGVCTGIGIGRAVVLRDRELSYAHVRFAGAEEEKARLAAAMEAFALRRREMADRSADKAAADILLGQTVMLSDPYLRGQTEEYIDTGVCAEGALDRVCRDYIALFSAMEDEVMCRRAADVEDIRREMLALLLGQEGADLSDLPADAVLVARELPPSVTAGLKPGAVAGIVTETGGATSHCAILARALGLSAVFGVSDVTRLVKTGDTVIVDGETGTVIVSPDAATLEEYKKRAAGLREDRDALAEYAKKPTKTKCGKVISLYANISAPTQVQAVLDAGGEGVGLFRSEFLFMERPDLPDEEEQLCAYRGAAQAMAGSEVIIRALDAGGDKALPGLDGGEEENPFLGLRGVRLCLEREAVFRTQLRAVLRASAFGRVKLMLPMVSDATELRRVRAILSELTEQLEAEGVPFERDIPVGVMIETPAAALMADALAREADFFSIGTNDLTQYVMAADRGNGAVASLCSPFHPAVLRCIRRVIAAGRAAGIPVGLCGEAAADARMIPLLLAFGLEEFSVSPAAILPTRKAIAGWSMADAAALTQRVMACTTAEEVLEQLNM